MSDGAGNTLAYTLKNSTSGVGSGGVFTTFDGARTETGSVNVDTADITKAGSYSGTMTFTISYQ